MEELSDLRDMSGKDKTNRSRMTTRCGHWFCKECFGNGLHKILNVSIAVKN